MVKRKSERKLTGNQWKSEAHRRFKGDTLDQLIELVEVAPREHGLQSPTSNPNPAGTTEEARFGLVE